MLIRKINSVFMRHSRWLFGIFTIVIIVSFLGFLTPGQFGVGGCSDPMNTRVGVAFGDPITYGQLRDQQQAMATFYRVAYGMNVRDIEPREAFGMICVQRAAQNRGITASDTEIAQALSELPIFRNAEGKFDYKKYQTTMEELRKQGIDGDLVAAAFRNVILDNKLKQELMDAVVTTPAEVENFYRQANSRYQVKVAEFSAPNYNAAVKVKADALKEYFTKHHTEYRIPAQLTAELVEFSYNDPAILTAAAKVDDNAVKSYFDAHREAFAGKDGKEPDFAKSKADAKVKLIAENARKLAVQRAQQFARDAYEAVDEARTDRVAAFGKLAADRKLKTVKTAKFSADAKAIGKLAEPMLVKQLAGVYENVPVTNVVPGTSAAYVGIVLTYEAERPALFNEVARRVQDEYIRQEAVKLAREAADKEAKTLAALPTQSRLAAKAWDRTVDFSLAEPPQQLEGAQAIVMNALPLKPGELAKPITTPDGALLVTLVKRMPADMKKFADKAEADKWGMIWKQTKFYAQQSDFNNYLSSQCSYELESNRK